MFKESQNLCKSVMQQFTPKNEWSDRVYLSDECKERFLTNTDIPELGESGYFMAGLAELEAGYEIEREGIGIHTLLVTLEGSGVLITPEFVKELKPYSLTVLPAGLPYRFELHPDFSHWKMVWILLDQLPKWDDLISGGQAVLPFESSEQVWSLMNLLHLEINGRPAYRRLLISEVSRILAKFEAQPYSSAIRVQTTFNEIEAQLHHDWTVKSIAKKCFISQEQLNRVCKSLYGMSPRSKLIQLRMDKATDLLRYEDWAIALIAQRLGYNDPYNFTHRFRKYFGCSPREYRKGFREADSKTSKG
ncbi:helix-turn-helix transcriptional regulator [Vibrio comitans]|nr:AraC family transcriptional regulator [Vibrio comitans]